MSKLTKMSKLIKRSTFKYPPPPPPPPNSWIWYLRSAGPKRKFKKTKVRRIRLWVSVQRINSSKCQKSCAWQRIHRCHSGLRGWVAGGSTFFGGLGVNFDVRWMSAFRRQVPSTKIHNPAEENTTLAIPCNFSGDFDELEERVKSMMEKSQNEDPSGNCKAHRCKVCGKEGRGSAIKDHIEANHLEGIVIPCNLCDKTFRSRNGLRLHKIQH